jgi:hypothetical protein
MLPFHSFQANAAWLELALTATDIIVWTQALTLDSEHQTSEPKRLRYRILHVAGQLTRHARQTTLHLPADWPWAAAITRAFGRLEDLPPSADPSRHRPPHQPPHSGTSPREPALETTRRRRPATDRLTPSRRKHRNLKLTSRGSRESCHHNAATSAS